VAFKSEIYPLQKKEISGKMIVCNIHRFLQFLVFEVFYRTYYSINREKIENSGYNGIKLSHDSPMFQFGKQK